MSAFIKIAVVFVAGLVFFLSQVFASSYESKRLPEILEYATKKCAVLVKVLTHASAEQNFVLTTPVQAQVLKKWGNANLISARTKSFRVVNIQNLKKGKLTNHEGDDYYSESLSPTELKKNQNYILLCRDGENFEAMQSNAKNQRKVKLFMRPKWQQEYAQRMKIPELRADLSDSDLYPFAYNALRAKRKLTDKTLISAMQRSADPGLLAFHLAKLEDPKLAPFALSATDPEINVRIEKQFRFLQLLVNELGSTKNDNLLSVFSAIVSTSLFYSELSQAKYEIVFTYLNILQDAFPQKALSLRDPLLEKIVLALGREPKMAAGLSPFYLQYATSQANMVKTLALFVDALPAWEKIKFLNECLVIYEGIAKTNPGSKAPMELFRVLEKFMPRYPSGLYVRNLSEFNPFYNDAAIRDMDAFRALTSSTPDVTLVKDKAKGLLTAVEFMVHVGSAVIAKTPKVARQINDIIEPLIGGGGHFTKYVDPRVINEYRYQLAKVDLAGGEEEEDLEDEEENLQQEDDAPVTH